MASSSYRNLEQENRKRYMDAKIGCHDRLFSGRRKNREQEREGKLICVQKPATLTVLQVR